MEPKSILEFGRESLENNCNESIKISYEHYIDDQRHLNAIVNGEFGFPINKVVFITRDVRDKMISRLLYIAKPMRNQALPKDSPAEKWAQWIELLEEKERRPRDISFRFLCDRFKAIFDMDVWANITRMQESVRYESFRNKGVARETIVVAYEDMVAGRMTALESYLGVTLPSDMSTVHICPFGSTDRKSVV